MIDTPFLTRQERFRTVGSTNDIVRGWLAAGTPEVCLAVAESRNSRLIDDFFVAARETAEITAECGNYEMWQPAR